MILATQWLTIAGDPLAMIADELPPTIPVSPVTSNHTTMPPRTHTEAIQATATNIKTYLGELNKHIDNSLGDMTRIKDLVVKLQTTPGPISTADQATLDELETLTKAGLERMKALDELGGEPPVVEPDPNAPTTPTVPPVAGGTGDPTAPGAGEPVVSPGGTSAQPAPEAGTAGKPSTNFP